MLRLSSWGNAWLEHHIDAETGLHKMRLSSGPPSLKEAYGFARYEPVWGVLWRFYAVYGHAGRFIFQAGMRRWDLTEGNVEVGFKAFARGAAARIVVRHNGDAIHQALLIHPFRTFDSLDPTFDDIDADQTHFFYFISKCIGEDRWRNNVIKLGGADA